MRNGANLMPYAPAAGGIIQANKGKKEKKTTAAPQR
jgi:hypothetical protein